MFKPTKKLQLKKEVLRTLTSAELYTVRGGQRVAGGDGGGGDPPPPPPAPSDLCASHGCSGPDTTTPSVYCGTNGGSGVY